jgi:hypothetical protein
MVMSLEKGLAILVAAFLLLSCGMMVRPGQEFETVSRDYVQRLRWMDFAGASRHQSGESREAFMQRFGELGDLHIVDARLESVDLREEAGRADTSIVLEYYLLPSATVKQFRLEQEWAYLGGDRYRPGVWRIVSPFSGFP